MGCPSKAQFWLQTVKSFNMVPKLPPPFFFGGEEGGKWWRGGSKTTIKKIMNFSRDKTALETRTLSLLLFSDHNCFFLSTADCIIAYIDTTLCDCISMSYRRQITCRQPEIHGGEDCPKQCYTGQLITGSKSCSWDDLDTFKCAASRWKPFNIVFSLMFTTAFTYICSRDPWFKIFHFTVACLV